jgi:hypothetical protein
MLRRTLLAAPLVLAAAPAFAQWVPRQPIKILVGYAPGGTADITARLAADTIQRQRGYTVIVDNKTGMAASSPSRPSPSRRPTITPVASASWASLPSGRSCRARRSRSTSTRAVKSATPEVGVPMALIVRMDAPFGVPG